MQGCFTINEERLNKLSNHTFISFKEKGCLASIYLQFISLQFFV
ncbi:SapC family protein [Nitrincola alkalisediminis]